MQKTKETKVKAVILDKETADIFEIINFSDYVRNSIDEDLRNGKLKRPVITYE